MAGRKRANDEPQSLIDGALFWAEHGVPVFPCKSDKRPLTTNGFKDAVTDPQKVRDLFAFFGDAATMIGAAMGSKAGMFAIDFDLYKGNGVQEFADQLSAQGLLPETRVHNTMNGGVHVFYKAEKCPSVNPIDGVEVRGDGSYVIMPPSPGYSVVSEGIAEAPPKLIDFLRRARKAASDDTVSGLKEKIRNAENFHDSIARLAARLFGSGMDAASVTQEILATLNGSLASSAAHPRHDRWRDLVENKSNELGRILSTGDSKYNPRTASEEQAAAFTTDNEQFEKMKAVAGAAFKQGKKHADEAPKVKSIEDFGEAWPFEGEGYFAHVNHDLLSQRFVLHPILSEDESILIAAEPKTGKTAIALTAGLHIAAGLDLGESLRVAEPRGVLYFGLEGRRAIRLRIAAWRARIGELGKVLPDFIPLFVVERGKNLLHEVERQNLANAIAVAAKWMEREHGISLGAIFIDTYTKAMPGGDQNSVEDTSAVFDVVTRVREHGITAAVAFIHHKSRAGNIRGSTNIEADPDVLTSIFKEGNRVTWSLDRARSVEEGATYHFAISNYSLGVSSQGFPINAPFVEPVDADTPSTSDIAAAKEEGRALTILIGLGKGNHKIQAVYDVLFEAGLAPVAKSIRRGGNNRKLRYDNQIVQDYFAELIPITGRVFGGHSFERIIDNDGRIVGIHIF